MDGTTDQAMRDGIEAPEELTGSDVEGVLSTLTKALRATQIYQPNNPVVQRFQKALRAAFDDLWDKTGALEVTVLENGFRWQGEVFDVGEGRDNLAFLFYKDGIRYLTFLPGFEDEVGPFMAIIQKAKRLKREDDQSDDLITLLWEQDFDFFQYGYVDLLAEGLAVPEEADIDLPTIDASAVEEEVAGAVQQEASSDPQSSDAAAAQQGLSREDFEETLYFLDPSELATLQEEIEVEMERDLKADVIRALFDRLEDPLPERRAQILGILDEFLPILLRQGDLRASATILRELEAMVADDGPLAGGEHEQDVARLFDGLSEPAVLTELVRLLEEGSIPPDSEELALFFGRLNPNALPILIRALDTSTDEAVRARLSNAVSGLASEHPEHVVSLLSSEDAKVVEGAAKQAGELGFTNAAGALQQALDRPEPEVRLAAVEALVAIRNTAALNALLGAIDDDDREVRVAAIRGLGAVKYASARSQLFELIDGGELKDADLTEKIAVFEALGSIGGAQVVERFDDVLNHKGFLGRRNPSEMRACAALGLGKEGSPAAREALRKATDEEDAVVRNAVMRGLRQGDEDG